MAGGVSTLCLYALADLFMMEVHRDREGKVTGEVAKKVDFGGLKIEMPVKIVSSYLDAKGGGGAFLVKIMGNLILSVVLIEKQVSIGVVNLAKLKARPSQIFVDMKSLADCVQAIDNATVRRYAKSKSTDWREIGSKTATP